MRPGPRFTGHSDEPGGHRHERLTSQALMPSPGMRRPLPSRSSALVCAADSVMSNAIGTLTVQGVGPRRMVEAPGLDLPIAPGPRRTLSRCGGVIQAQGPA